MICSVRLEAYGDTPQQVKDDLDAGLVRLGLGIGDVTDEVYERDREQFLTGYKGRIKVLYQVPMTATEEQAYEQETSEIGVMVGRRLAEKAENVQAPLGTVGGAPNAIWHGVTVTQG